MDKLLQAATAMCAILFGAPSNVPGTDAISKPPPAKTAQIVIHEVVCEDTTDGFANLNREDELYVVVLMKGKENGQEHVKRRPDPGHFSLKVGDTTDLGNQKVIWEDMIEGNHTQEFTILLMEKDDAPAEKVMEAARVVLDSIETDDALIGAAVEVAKVLRNILKENTDDFIGSCSVRATNLEEEFQKEWKLGEHGADHTPDEGATKWDKVFEFTGDGSKYTVRIGIQAS